MAIRLIEHLNDTAEFNGLHGVPSVAFNESTFDPVKYWCGAIWINMMYMLQSGLFLPDYRRLPMAQTTADRLGQQANVLTANNNWHEYFNAQTGEGLGTSNFCWSALATLMTQG